MKFSAVSTANKRPKADLVIVPFFKGKKEAILAATVADLKGDIQPILKAGDFTGKLEATMLTYLSGKK